MHNTFLQISLFLLYPNLFHYIFTMFSPHHLLSSYIYYALYHLRLLFHCESVYYWLCFRASSIPTPNTSYAVPADLIPFLHQLPLYYSISISYNLQPHPCCPSHAIPSELSSTGFPILLYFFVGK